MRDVATDQQNAGTTLTLGSTATRPRASASQPQLIDETLYDAFGQRQVTQYFTQVNTYRRDREILPELQKDPATLDKMYLQSPVDRRDGAAVALSPMDDTPVQPLSINHQGQFPAVTFVQPAPGRGARHRRSTRSRRRRDEMRLPRSLIDDLPGHRPGVPGFAGAASRC